MRASIAAPLVCAFTQAAGAEPAEYAMRWQSGGPASAAEAMAALGRKVDAEDAYDIQYFDVGKPAQPAFDAIGRMRHKDGGKYELTYKLRGAGPPNARVLPDKWNCPLAGAPKFKYEVDISVLAATEARRYSLSCELESKAQALAFPPSMQATPKGCVSRMLRLSAGAVRVEEWHIPGVGTLLEVSMTGQDRPEDLAAFRALVQPLMTPRLQISDRSKTEAGSDCH